MKLTERPKKIVQFYFLNNKDITKTLQAFNIKLVTLQRYILEYNKVNNIQNQNIENTQIEKKTPEEIQKEKILTDISKKYTVKELQAISKGYDPTINVFNSVKLNFKGQKVKIGVISDTHIGSKSFVEEWWDSALKVFEDENVDFICHVGDLVEGLSERKGHWYDLTHIGYEPQKKYAIELLNRTSIPIYGIDGNHDRWFIKSANALICKDISENVTHYHFLGSDEGDIYLNNNVFIKLWHGEDGSSYATSYRIQKIIESFTGGEKPNVLLAGHVHKAAYLPGERNIFAFSAGALCKQSAWMRSKKLANHSGFWIIDINYDDNSILSCKGEFFQFYSKK